MTIPSLSISRRNLGVDYSVPLNLSKLDPSSEILASGRISNPSSGSSRPSATEEIEAAHRRRKTISAAPEDEPFGQARVRSSSAPWFAQFAAVPTDPEGRLGEREVDGRLHDASQVEDASDRKLRYSSNGASHPIDVNRHNDNPFTNGNPQQHDTPQRSDNPRGNDNHLLRHHPYSHHLLSPRGSRPAHRLTSSWESPQSPPEKPLSQSPSRTDSDSVINPAHPIISQQHPYNNAVKSPHPKDISIDNGSSHPISLFVDDAIVKASKDTRILPSNSHRAVNAEADTTAQIDS